jgi:methionyl-tRNA synthetase
LIGRVDKYIVENEPWVLAGAPERAAALDSVLFHAAEALRLTAVTLAPVLPKSAQTIWEQLGLDGAAADQRLDALAWSNVLEGKNIRPGGALFPRLDPKEILNKLDAAAGAATPAADSGAGAPTAASPVAPIDPPITIDDFAKIDLRVGTVLEAERVKGADKLLRLVVDIGIEKRQIVAGIATAYTPEALVGRKVVIVANLQPRKLRGLESNGMVVAASLEHGDKPALIGLLEDVANGARLR